MVAADSHRCRRRDGDPSDEVSGPRDREFAATATLSERCRGDPVSVVAAAPVAAAAKLPPATNQFHVSSVDAMKMESSTDLAGQLHSSGIVEDQVEQ